jgi:hypothetical protein
MLQGARHENRGSIPVGGRNRHFNNETQTGYGTQPESYTMGIGGLFQV